MKLLLLFATTLLFYTEATEEKKCEIKEYVITKTEATFAASKTACNDLNGEIASEDLKDSENADKAKAVVDNFRKTHATSSIYIGVTSRNLNESPHESENPFVFTDQSVFDDTNFVYMWETNNRPEQPDYTKPEKRCAIVFYERGSDKMASWGCDQSAYGLCKVFENCDSENGEGTEDENDDDTGDENGDGTGDESEGGTGDESEDENSANSESGRSRANLPVFALFMACSVFVTFYALVGIVF